ncbi:hypothetical protein [Rhizobium lusitanum]|uniref:Uncharacterized protein n=1 Tax=Rhizobium lusitanum TaxID=293958 RepID=A0A7X0MH62_9HYPH|nr:hypothetical protein [Rhizobium lusitanum]MBB6488890.1 hypothetical protein [Rhizobium lusitanum]
MIISFTRDLGATLISEMGGRDEGTNPTTVRAAAYGIDTLKGPIRICGKHSSALN